MSRSKPGLGRADCGHDGNGGLGRNGGRRRIGRVFGCFLGGFDGCLVDLDRDDLGHEVVGPTCWEFNGGGGIAHDLLAGFASDHKTQFITSGVLDTFGGVESVNFSLEFIGGFLMVSSSD